LPAVDQQILAGDEAGVGRAQERDVSGDLVGLAVAAGRIGGTAFAPDVSEAAPALGGERRDMLALAVRGDDARQDVVDGDVVFDGLAGDAGDEADEASFS